MIFLVYERGKNSRREFVADNNVIVFENTVKGTILQHIRDIPGPKSLCPHFKNLKYNLPTIRVKGGIVFFLTLLCFMPVPPNFRYLLPPADSGSLSDMVKGHRITRLSSIVFAAVKKIIFG
jgi:hypothetical protein